jgi:hypothetical protein
MPAVPFNQWIEQNRTIFVFTPGPTQDWRTISIDYNEPSYMHGPIHYSVHWNSGDIYLQKTTDNLLAIAWACLAGRPVKVFLKTAYHLFLPISIPYEIFTTFQKEMELRERHPERPAENLYLKCSVSVIHSLADIVRTPLYGSVLMVLHISTIFVYIFDPKATHRLRLITGQIELELERGRRERCLLRCFQPLDNLMTVDRRSDKIEGIVYPENSTPAQIGLINLIHAIFKKRDQELQSSFSLTGIQVLAL